ncbi:MAG: hypothetical protein QG594_1438 [Bacteroidota bacterium]|nr:hypothetical protein [Bacteroidota bacterium]
MPQVSTYNRLLKKDPFQNNLVQSKKRGCPKIGTASFFFETTHQSHPLALGVVTIKSFR